MSPSNDKIRTSHYQKPMANPFVIMYRSAIPTRTKKDSLLQENFRRIRNMGSEAPDGERIMTLGKFMNSLKMSEYDWGFRYHLLR